MLQARNLDRYWWMLGRMCRKVYVYTPSIDRDGPSSLIYIHCSNGRGSTEFEDREMDTHGMDNAHIV